MAQQPNKPLDEQGQVVQLTETQLIRLLKEAKSPYVDPDVERRKQQTREQFIADQKAKSARETKRQKNCNHLRDKDNTSTFAWYLFRSGNYQLHKGVCQRCFKSLSNEDTDPSEYLHWRAIPTGVTPLYGEVKCGYNSTGSHQLGQDACETRPISVYCRCGQ